MRSFSEIEQLKGHGSIHPKMLYVHNHRLVLGEPLLVTDKTEKN